LFFGSLVLVMFALGLIHRAERTVVNRLTLANQLVSELKEDREGLIRADEAVRLQTSRFLHDRVQSELMVVAMKLKAVAGKSSDDVNRIIEESISSLESTRTADLKNLVQILAPNFEVGGLAQAIHVLSKQYAASMKVDIQVDETSELLNQERLLAVFRIAEQSLINSLVHGPADRAAITVKTNSLGITELVVSDNGPGVNLDDVKSGTGSAVIDAWVSILQGQKAIDTVSGNGYRIAVTFAE
jgi:signal transduction histidine kinase